MAPVPTHKGGPFYEWYLSVYGYAPPPTVDSNAARYLAWQQGIPKNLAAEIPYGSIGQPSQFIPQLAAGGALVAPVQVITPASPTPVTQPAATLLEPGVTAAPPAPAPASEPTATTANVPVKTLPTCYGIPYDGTQLVVVHDVLQIGQSLGASRLVLEAAVYALMGESTIHDDSGGGWFQTSCNLSAYNGGSDYKAQAHSFFSGGECFARGAISYSSEYKTAWQIANATEENAIWASRRGDSYARGGYTTAQLTAEAAYAVTYMLGGSAPATAPVSQQSVPAPSAGGVFNLFQQTNWAGDFENLWKYVQGGSNEAANMAKNFNEGRLAKTDYINWPH